jgi:phage-related protein
MTVIWHGRSREEIQAFPETVRKKLGRELYKVECGKTPSDTKPITAVAPGCWELRLRAADTCWRLIYLHDNGNVVALACVQKNQSRLPQPDADLVKQRYASYQKDKERR